jgi:hypothetical protein
MRAVPPSQAWHRLASPTFCVDLLIQQAHHPRMDRRRFLLTSLAGAVITPLDAQAQQARRVPTIGLMGQLPSFSDYVNWGGARAGLSQSSIAGLRGAATALPRLQRSSCVSRSM